jgi:hypothetical protein
MTAAPGRPDGRARGRARGQTAAPGATPGRRGARPGPRPGAAAPSTSERSFCWQPAGGAWTSGRPPVDHRGTSVDDATPDVDVGAWIVDTCAKRLTTTCCDANDHRTTTSSGLGLDRPIREAYSQPVAPPSERRPETKGSAARDSAQAPGRRPTAGRPGGGARSYVTRLVTSGVRHPDGAHRIRRVPPGTRESAAPRGSIRNRRYQGAGLVGVEANRVPRSAGTEE